MASLPPPKAVLFDIGGVVVVSPFQAILDYELTHSIPPGYINHTISRTSPSGAWQRIERGEIPLGPEFFTAFRKELTSEPAWRAYWSQILADPQKRQSLPKDYRDGTKKDIPAVADINTEELFWNMMRMARRPDPFMYPALLKLRESGEFVVAALSNTIDFPEGIKDEKGVVFNSAFTNSLNDATSGNAAPKSKYADKQLKEVFETFVSSAHVGMRKPERRIYELAVQEVQKVGKSRGIEIAANEILFIDDIGSNLKAGRELGMRTLRVFLGKTKDAVERLEKEVGMDMIDGKAKL